MSKAPLGERAGGNQVARWTAAQPGRWTQKEPHAALEVVGPPRPLAVNTGTPKEGRSKRQRDAAATRSKHRPALEDAQKKLRAHEVEQGSQRDGVDSRAPGRPRLDRRVGGVAPNGNPQCWYAPNESETDPHRVAQRKKQVEYGKNSEGYKNYSLQVPKNRRRNDDPQTPDVHTKCSKRCFDGLLRSWRRRLHRYDPPDPEAHKGGTHTAIEVKGDGSVVHDQNEQSQANLQEPSSPAPVPWEEIEKMSLCTPRGSWVDDFDSDCSEADDRITIITTELSPTPSKMEGRSSEAWATPRSRLSPNILDDIDDLPAATTPPSPFSPWAPWATDKRSFADALRSPPAPLLVGKPDGEGAHASGCEGSRRLTAQSPDVMQSPSQKKPVEKIDPPLTFGAAFAAGALRSTGTAHVDDLSFFGAGVHLAATQEPTLPSASCVADLTAIHVLEPDGKSISMRATPLEAPCIPNLSSDA